MESPFAGLEEQIAYSFAKKELLVRALTHRSSVSDKATVIPDGMDNEPLEFLGDAVLGFVVSEALLRRFPASREGQLSQWKSHLVSAAHLHECALEIALGDYLVLGKGEERNGGRERKTLLANAFEAVIAAVHLDGGMAAAQSFIERWVLTSLDNLEEQGIELLNHKSVLQERTQALGLPSPRYSTVGSAGPQHARIFTVEVRVGDRSTSQATGSSKKTASQHAAKLMIEQLDLLEQAGSAVYRSD